MYGLENTTKIKCGYLSYRRVIEIYRNRMELCVFYLHDFTGTSTGTGTGTGVCLRRIICTSSPPNPVSDSL